MSKQLPHFRVSFKGLPENAYPVLIQKPKARPSFDKPAYS
jgi:hypothetical protein